MADRKYPPQYRDYTLGSLSGTLQRPQLSTAEEQLADFVLQNTPITSRTKPNDYTLFSRGAMQPEGSPYGYGSAGTFDPGRMRLKRMNEAQIALDMIKRERQQASPPPSDEFRRLIYSQSPTIPPDRLNARGEFIPPAPPATSTPPGKLPNRASPADLGNYATAVSRPPMPYFGKEDIAKAPMRVSTAPSGAYPTMAAMEEARKQYKYPYAEQPAPEPSTSPAEQAIRTTKQAPSSFYRAVTSPVQTAKKIADAVFSGEDVQSDGNPVVENGVINWGDIDNPADFFRADQAMQQLYPFGATETEAPVETEEYNTGGRTGYADEGAVVADTDTTSAPATREQIQDLYQTQLGREADTGGLDYWDTTDLSYNDLMPHFYDASMGSGQSTANNAYQPLAGYLEAQTAYNRSLMQGQPIGDIVSQKGQYLGYNQNSQNAINNYLKNNEITPGTITGSMGEFSANDARNLAAMMYGEARSGFGVKTDDDAAAEAWNRATNYLQGNMQDALEPYKNITNFNKASEDYNQRVAERAGTNLSNFNQLGGHSFFTYGNEADRLSKAKEIPYPPPRPDDLSFNMPAVGSNETFGTYDFNPLGDVSFATPGYEFNPLGEVSFATPSYDNFTVGLDTSYQSMPTFTNLSVNPSDYGGFSGSGNLGGASGLNTFSLNPNDYSMAAANLGYGGNSWDSFGDYGAFGSAYEHGGRAEKAEGGEIEFDPLEADAVYDEPASDRQRMRRSASQMTGEGYTPEEKEIKYQQMSELGDALAETWPAKAAKAAYSAARLPGDVLYGLIDPKSKEGIDRAMELAGLAMTGGFPMKAPEGSFRTFAGLNSKTADKGAWYTAKNMADEGAIPHHIWDKTGWFQGRDGKWRYEIPDTKIKLKEDYLNSEIKRIGQAIDHPELFKAYPQLKDVDFKMDWTLRGGKKEEPNIASWFGDPNRHKSLDRQPADLTIRPYIKNPEPILLHELQHGIQAIEKFSPGTNTNPLQYEVNPHVGELFRELLEKIIFH